MKKSAVTAILIGATVLGTGFVWHMVHGISLFARVDYGDKNMNTHSQADIREAVSIARKQFRDFEGCVMTEIYYDEALSREESDTVQRQGFSSLGTGFDDVICLKSTFLTGSPFASDMWNHCKQDSYGWIITHSPENGWEFRTAGYA